MIRCIVGVRTKDGNAAQARAMQRWLEAHGVNVYTPQVYGCGWLCGWRRIGGQLLRWLHRQRFVCRWRRR